MAPPVELAALLNIGEGPSSSDLIWRKLPNATLEQRVGARERNESSPRSVPNKG